MPPIPPDTVMTTLHALHAGGASSAAFADTVAMCANAPAMNPTVLSFDTAIDWFSKIAVGGSAILTALYAKWGISSWMRQKRSTEEHDIAVEILAQIYELRAYIDGSLNSSILWAGQAAMLNESLRGSFPDYVDPWQLPVNSAVEAGKLGAKLNTLIAKSKALATESSDIDKLNEFLSTSIFEFMNHQFVVAERIQRLYDPKSTPQQEVHIDYSAIQEGQKMIHIKFSALVDAFERVYSKRRIEPR